MPKKQHIPLNPLVNDVPFETLQNVQSVLEYMKWASLDETTEQIQEGQRLILSCCISAIETAKEPA